MLKRLSVALAALFLCAQFSFAAGTIPFSLTQQFGADNKPLSGCRLFTIQAGTVSSPQNAFQDTALTIALPNPVLCDAAGRLPQMFFADGQIKLRLENKNGVQQFAQDNILVIGPSSGGGGGGSTIDPTTILATGDLKVSYTTGTVTGFVRANGRTIGSATSGATERANADTQALFLYLWGADPNLVVSGGRGASAAADFAANKTIALPDFRSRALAGLGDMGNSDNALFSGVTFTTGNSTTLGASLGAPRRTLLTTNLPPYTPAGTNTMGGSQGITANVIGSGSHQTGSPGATMDNTTITIFGNSFSATFTGTAQGGTSTAFDTVSPLALVTIYMKL